MLLKVNKLPIITEGKGIVGNLEGLVFKEKSIKSIYCKLGKVFYHIPIEEVAIGKDAIIIKEQYIDKVIDICDLKEVFTSDGEQVGTLQYINLNEDYTFQSITVDELKISSENIINIDSSILVDLTPLQPIEEMEDSEEQPSDIVELEEEQDTVEEIEVITSDGIENIEKIEDTEDDFDEIEEVDEVDEVQGELSLELNEVIDIEEEKQECVLNTPVEITSISSDILSKYDYLHNKKLEETILIANERFTKGSIINQGLIEKAVSNNEIVKLVMAAEE